MSRFVLVSLAILAIVTPVWATEAGSALSFDGVNDVAQVPHGPSLNLGMQATVEFWLFPRSLSNPESGEWLMTKGDALGAALQIGGNAAMQFCVGPVSNTGLGTEVLPLLEWTHLAWTIDTSIPIVRVFLNGQPAGQTSQMQNGQPIPPQALCTNTAPLLIGGLPPFGNYLDGLMDEVRVWNVARTPAEIAANFNRRICPDTPGLIGYWKFNEPPGEQAILDSSPFANHGTLGPNADPSGEDPARVDSTAPLLPISDCNANGLPDECETIPPATITDHPDDQSVCAGAAATFSVTATGEGTLNYQWRKDGQAIPGATTDALVLTNVSSADAGDYDVVVTGPCGGVTSESATLTVLSNVPAPHYALTVLCPPATIATPHLLAFTDNGPAPGIRCAAERSFRLFAGRAGVATGKVWRLQQDCTAQLFGPLLCEPESVLVDRLGGWPGVCGLPNLLIVGGCDTIYFINPANGAICEQFPDPSFMHIGQMAIDSMGRLYVGSVEGDALHRVSQGVVEPFYPAPGLAPRAVAVDDQDNVYVTCAADGVMRKIAPNGAVLNANFATGLTGAVSQAIAPAGIFHGSIFVACGDRVMEVDRTSGASSVFLPCRQAEGVGFDPEGFLYVTEPVLNRILQIGPGLPGDMDGNGAVDLLDTPGFVLALLQDSAAPLPIRTADLNGDGCADGRDIPGFVAELVEP